ncbi:uncharacterized protein LOC117128518 [Brassica rapa]|uniref:uncharacterized protein LOC117128518 n=1 Tax=Brassica campestris TaxID=3711 RepID=UPI00142D2AF2|nr:uncharacterized protein LOC117128518 [Brassica rapa]
MDFKKRLLARFAESFEKTPGKRLFCLQQTGSIAEYVREFQELVSQIKLAEAHKIDIFFNGLKREMKEVIKMKEPQTLSDYIETVLKMEDSEFCKLFASVKGQENRVNKQSSSSTFRSLPSSAQNSVNKPKLFEQAARQSAPSLNPKQGRVKLSDAEFEHKKKNGICFSCDEKWSRAHSNTCKNKNLQVMVVVQGSEVELVDEEFHDSCEELFGTTTEICELTLYSYMGWSSPTTTKIEGKIGKTRVVVLIDSGATHNFLSPDIVKKAQLTEIQSSSFKVLVGTGSVDVVLGIQWLRTLGRCEVDWEKQELSFFTPTGRVTLVGDRDSKAKGSALQTISAGISLQHGTCSLFTSEDQKSGVIPQSLEGLLKQYSSIFQEPTELPPQRGYEHSIRLIEGAGTVAVRPYCYPHAHMEVIEQIVSQMLQSGVIRPSRSPYASPILLVKKKDGGWRFCEERVYG